jgi:hypothetical protein
MRAILADPIMQLALEVMADEHPGKHLPASDVTPHFAHIQLGQQTGYATYDNRLRLLGKGIEIPQEIPEATYPDETPEPEE